MHACVQVHQLEVTPARLLLRLPMTVRHIITESSPLSNWRSGQAGIAADASSEIIVVVSHRPCQYPLNIPASPCASNAIGCRLRMESAWPSSVRAKAAMGPWCSFFAHLHGLHRE